VAGRLEGIYGVMVKIILREGKWDEAERKQLTKLET
jgi:hypothetical protein